MITEAQFHVPPTDTPVLNAQEAGRPSSPCPINNSPAFSSSKLAILFESPTQHSTPFYCNCYQNRLSPPQSNGEAPEPSKHQQSSFLPNLLQMSHEIKAFFNKLLSEEGDIFLVSTIGCLRIKFFCFELLHRVVAQLERHKLLMISIDNLSEAAQAMDDVSSAG